MLDGFDYIHHENGIHQLIWDHVNQKSALQFVLIFNDLMKNAVPNSRLCILHEYRQSNTPPFDTLTKTLLDFTVREDVTLRIAHIYVDVMYPRIVKNATLVARFNAQRRFFRVGDEAQAIAWLMAE